MFGGTTIARSLSSRALPRTNVLKASTRGGPRLVFASDLVITRMSRRPASGASVERFVAPARSQSYTGAHDGGSRPPQPPGVPAGQPDSDWARPARRLRHPSMDSAEETAKARFRLGPSPWRGAGVCRFPG